MTRTSYQDSFSSAEFSAGSVRAFRALSLYVVPGMPQNSAQQDPRVFMHSSDRMNVVRLVGHWYGLWVPGVNESRCYRLGDKIFDSQDEAVNWFEENVKPHVPDDYTNLLVNTNVYREFLTYAPAGEGRRVVDTGVDGSGVYYITFDATIVSQFRCFSPHNASGESFVDCSCGYYGRYVTQPTQLLSMYSLDPEKDVIAAVDHFGETLVGEKGVRSSKARLAGLLLNENTLDLLDVETFKPFADEGTEIYSTIECSIEQFFDKFYVAPPV